MNVIEISCSRAGSLFPKADAGQHYDLEKTLLAVIEQSLLGDKFADFEWLRIDADCFGNLGALANLVNLKRLEISGCAPSQLRPVFNIETLEELSISDCHIGSEAFVSANLPNITSLDLNSCKLSDLHGLDTLTELAALSLDGSDVSDNILDDLTGLSGLKTLDLTDCPISTLAAFRNCIQMEVLNLDWSGISDLSSLTAFRNLNALSLGGTRANDLTPLLSLKKLERLDLSGTCPGSLEPLSDATALQSLNLSFADVPDLSPLIGHRSLRFIDLSWAKSLDTAPLTAFSIPVRVRVVGKQLTWRQKRRLCRSNIELIEDQHP